MDTINPLAANLEEVRISELPEATQANATDLLEASQVDGGQYISRKLALDRVTALIAGSAQIQDAIDAAIAAIPPPPPNDWDSIPGKPTTFPPAAHIHPESDITNLVTDLAQKAPIANPTFTGDPKAPTPATSDNDTSVATTAYVKANLAALPAPPTTLPPNGAAGGDLAGTYPNPTIKASVALTGNPTAPTPTAGDNDTSIATTAFVTAALAAGASMVLQTVSFQTGAMATGTTLIPYDDTIPQITEGDQYMTLAITPRSATSKLMIEVLWNGGNSVVNNMGLALFKDATANALAATHYTQSLAGSMTPITLTHTMTSGTTSAITFRVRVGGSVAGTTTFNGVTATRFYGGVMASSIVIQEVAP